MKNDKINYVLVGTFVLAMVAGLIASIAVLTGRTGATDDYYTAFDDVTGLKFGSQVLYMGYPVGQVEEITPVREDGRLRFDVKMALGVEFADWRVPKDSVAEIRAAGLLAAITIDIRTGQSDEALMPGSRIRGADRADVFGALADTANTLRTLTLTTVKPLLENVNRYVTSFGSVLEKRGAPLVDNLAQLSEVLVNRAPGVIDDFLATTAEIRAVGQRLQVVLSDESAGKIRNVVDRVADAAEDFAVLARTARTQLDVILGAKVTGQLDSMLDNLDAASRDAAALARNARERTAVLLSDENVDRVGRTLENVDAASAGVRAMVGPEQQRQVQETVDSVSRAADDLQALIADTRAQLRGLLGPETAAKLDRALVNVAGAAANVASLSAHLDARVGDVLTKDVAAKLKHMLENFALAAANVATLTADLRASRELLDRLLGELAGTAAENRADVRASVQDLRHILGAVSMHVDAVAQNLEGTSRNFYELSRRLKANPGMLLRSASPLPDEGG